MIGQWEKLFTPSTPLLMTPSSGESIRLAALRIMRVFQANRQRLQVNDASLFLRAVRLAPLEFLEGLARFWMYGEPVLWTRSRKRREIFGGQRTLKRGRQAIDRPDSFESFLRFRSFRGDGWKGRHKDSNGNQDNFESPQDDVRS